MITGAQIKAGRVLLKMTQQEVANLTKANIFMVKRIEKSEGNFKGSAAVFYSIQRTLEERGIRFVNNEEGIGVILVKNKKNN